MNALISILVTHSQFGSQSISINASQAYWYLQGVSCVGEGESKEVLQPPHQACVGLEGGLTAVHEEAGGAWGDGQSWGGGQEVGGVAGGRPDQRGLT